MAEGVHSLPVASEAISTAGCQSSAALPSRKIWNLATVHCSSAGAAAWAKFRLTPEIKPVSRNSKSPALLMASGRGFMFGASTFSGFQTG